MKQTSEAVASRAEFRGSAVLRQAYRRGRSGWVTGHRGVDRSLGYLARKYRQPIRVMDLAQVSGLSRRGFLKAFQQHVGTRPAKLLTHARIEHAKTLLADARLPLDEVARQSGYRSLNTFWVAFRRIAGVPPGEFQQQVKQRRTPQSQ
jgi:transcriptional regulator GlxA family with amidase domain